MRFDELMTVKMDSFKYTKHGVSFSVEERAKKECYSRLYVLRRWPGKTFSNSISMDVRVAVTSWILASGDNSGYSFCNIVGKGNLRIVHDEPWLKSSCI